MAPEAAAVSDAPSATVILIHGVGGFVDEKARRDSERLIRSTLGDGRQVDLRWIDWNSAIDEPADSIDSLENIADATRSSARLEFPDRIDGSVRASFWRLEAIVAGLQLPLMALFLAHSVWLAAAWAARLLHQEPPPLELEVRLTHLLFPPLDPVLLERSFSTALATWPFTAMTALAVVPAIQIALAVISGGVPFRVALRGAVLDLTRPLLALLTMPGYVSAILVVVAGGLALFFAIFSRPVQIVSLEGAPVTYGGDRAGIMLLPLAIFTGVAIFAITSFLLGGVLKVISDIVRYLGHPRHRTRIHALLLDQLADLETRPLVIVAHSLGSVIAVDSMLAHPEAWSRFPRLRLLTCGSPLRRLFHGFFPATYPAPEALLRLLQHTYGDVSWTNVFRPLDYVGARLGRVGTIKETRLPQRRHLHVAYWTDRELADRVNELVGEAAASTPPPSSTPSPTTTAPLSLNRFRYGTLGGERLFTYVRRAVYVAGCVILAWTHAVWVPRTEREHLLDWHRGLNAEGAVLTGELCPQRELDISDESPSFYERAVAGVRYRTPDGRLWTLEAYSDSRPDIAWDEVQKAVFGKVPPSALYTGLRAAIFLKDPLIAIQKCQPVDVRYRTSDPRVFQLPERFHVTPGVTRFTRLRRGVLLFLLWSIWWWVVVSPTIAVSLGLPGLRSPELTSAGARRRARSRPAAPIRRAL